MSVVNPYRIPAGPELDRLIHLHVMSQSSDQWPSYSTDDRAARQVLSRLKSLTGRSVITGKTSMRRARWFARYESDPSDGTEVLAESLALAICRLALVHVSKDVDLSSSATS